MKYNIIITLDYEIHGNGDGSPYKLMVETTSRLMNLLDKYGARLTIMADVAEILCFKKYYEETGNDKFHYLEIEAQLIDAIRRGHDVQLHIHSSYFKATYNGKKWDQFVDEYNMARLPYTEIETMLSVSVKYLNDLLKPINPAYRCHAFRAAAWSMMPTLNIYKALVSHGIDVDTSVYKGGVQGGNVCYDYREAYSDLLPYKSSKDNINYFDPNGVITEYPIYTEMRYFWSFISVIRIFRMIRAQFHKHKKQTITPDSALLQKINVNENKKLTIKSFFIKNPWKFDINQASGRQMRNAFKHIKNRKLDNEVIDIVLIGHSKSFIYYNEKTLSKFLRYLQKEKNVVYRSFDN